MGSFDFHAYRQTVCGKIAGSCQDVAEVEPLLAQLRETAAEAERLIGQHPADRSRIDCGPGCSSCCVVNVSTLLPEGLAIVAYLERQGQPRGERVAEKLELLWREVRGLDDDDRMFIRRSCAFLDEHGCCCIYPVRPLLCRSISSTSATDCRDALSGKLLGEEKAVLMHQYQQQLYEALFSALGEGLEASGLDGRSFQLTGLVRYLLKHPDAGCAWLNGDRLTWQDIY